MASYREVHYSRRPAKRVHQKMIVDALQGLEAFATLDRYRYIGLGSISFNDFSLVHRRLGIEKMISIERAEGERCEFNAPFNSIEVIEGETNDVLPRLDYEIPTICWLDFDSKLTKAVLRDVNVLAKRLESGSVLIVTLNAQPDPLDERVPELTDNVGAGHVPGGTSESDMAQWGTSEVYREILQNEIDEALTETNAMAQGSIEFQDDHIFNFQYQDAGGPKMVTAGWVIYQAMHAKHRQASGLSCWEFTEDVPEPYRIKVPILTEKEILFLNDQLPPGGDLPDVEFLPRKDIQDYAKIYSYMPTFVETILD